MLGSSDVRFHLGDWGMSGHYEGRHAGAVGRALDGAGSSGAEQAEIDHDPTCDLEEGSGAARGVFLGILLGSALWVAAGFTASAIQAAWGG